jgi:hypothetical protein
MGEVIASRETVKRGTDTNKCLFTVHIKLISRILTTLPQRDMRLPTVRQPSYWQVATASFSKTCATLQLYAENFLISHVNQSLYL